MAFYHLNSRLITIFFLLFALGAITTVSADEGFFDGLGGFIDSIGNVVESIDFSSFIPSSSYGNSYGNKRSTYYYHNNWLDTYLTIRLIDSFWPNYYHAPCPVGKICETKITPPTLADKLLGQSLLAVTSIALTLIIMFTVLDLFSRRSVRGKRIGNILILWIFALIGCISSYLTYHLLRLLWIGAIAFFPYFWPYFLGISIILFGSYCALALYKKSGIRVVRKLPEHMV
ncbi:Hypothetical protein HVR_LOCUS134 [uncultured virus]|nr:Hypothetical protein HVR_LOCUS134 [uncultured virus]